MATYDFQDRLTQRLRRIERLRLEQDSLRRQKAPLIKPSLLRELGRDISRELTRGLWRNLAIAGGSFLFICLGALAAFVSSSLFLAWLAVFGGLMIYAVGVTIYAVYRVTAAVVFYFTWKGAK